MDEDQKPHRAEELLYVWILVEGSDLDLGWRGRWNLLMQGSSEHAKETARVLNPWESLKELYACSVRFSSVQLLSHVRLFVTP